MAHILVMECRLVAQSGDAEMSALAPLLGAERTSAPFWLMSTPKLPRSGSLTTGPGVALQLEKSALALGW